MTIRHFPLGWIEANPFQVRLEEDAEHVARVASSIAQTGLLQTPVGRAHPEKDNIVQIAFGHTRLAAYRQLRDENVAGGGKGGEWCELPVDVRELSDREIFELAVRENLERKNLTLIEEARAMLTYRDTFGKTSAEIGQLFGLGDSAVRNRMRLLDLPAPVQDQVTAGEITENTARKLLTLQKVAPRDIEHIADQLVKGGYETGDSITEVIAGVLEKKAFVMDGAYGRSLKGDEAMAGQGLWPLSWTTGRVKTPKAGAAAEGLGDDAKRIKHLDDLLAAAGAGTDAWGLVELFGISYDLADRVAHLVAPPACTACELQQTLDGAHYCAFKPCWEGKRQAWVESETHRISGKLGIGIYDKAADGKAFVSAPGEWGGTGGQKLHSAWVKLLRAKDPSLRLRGHVSKYTQWPGTGSYVVELIRVGKPAERAKAEAKSHHGSPTYDWEAERRKQQAEARRADAARAFLQQIAAPLLAGVIAPHENPEALRLIFHSMRGVFSRNLRLPSGAKPAARLAALRVTITKEVLEHVVPYSRLREGPKTTAKHVAGIAKTLGVKLPKSWDEAAASFERSVSPETEPNDGD